jgi:hypothetical protein
MIWDKLFWSWFVIIASMAIYLLLEEATTFNIVFGSMLIGLGLTKIAGERAKDKGLKADKKILEKLKR